MNSSTTNRRRRLLSYFSPAAQDERLPADWRRHEQEFTDSRLASHLASARDGFADAVRGQTYRGDPYGFGAMPLEAASRLYALIREFRPLTAVETGVCNGVSTAAILSALDANGQGQLFSLDFPEFANKDYQQGTFWEGKKGAVVPDGRQPGWLVPHDLREGWRLSIGRSQEQLEPLLDRLERIDFFLHDSEHSRDCMLFEYESAWKYLTPGAVLASDDVTWNDAFLEFAADRGKTPHFLTPSLAFLIR